MQTPVIFNAKYTAHIFKNISFSIILLHFLCSSSRTIPFLNREKQTIT